MDTKPNLNELMDILIDADINNHQFPDMEKIEATKEAIRKFVVDAQLQAFEEAREGNLVPDDMTVINRVFENGKNMVMHHLRCEERHSSLLEDFINKAESDINKNEDIITALDEYVDTVVHDKDNVSRRVNQRRALFQHIAAATLKARQEGQSERLGMNFNLLHALNLANFELRELKENTTIDLSQLKRYTKFQDMIYPDDNGGWVIFEDVRKLHNQEG